jgi:hypothetical protein
VVRCRSTADQSHLHFGWDRLPDTTLAGGANTASSMTNGSVAAVAQGGTAATANSSMTNGSVATASASGGAKQLTITYKDGQQSVRAANGVDRYD